ncbi:hypothetical protein TSOC_006917 [Tetrabaena socialis]|uniref:Uncharacterized protein n=1 Tax=Tetrabaena socialis TaxID=47790 RepID=A0A2J8A2E5_9CHLO|nr:hypothetical protein TSOC_006917 [Tetrabaena socialis]|eukprot:PNH06701.1 hypothetical protein TSOC_006917 [Tetrabaena socialis]
MPTPFDAPAPKPATDTSCIAAAEECGAAETDPVVAHVPVWASEDGTVVFADAQGNEVRVGDVFGAASELTGFMDEHGAVAYYVVIRQSRMVAHAAHLEQLEAEQHQLLLGTSAGVDADADAGHVVASGGGAEDEDLDDLLALCMGGGGAIPSVVDYGAATMQYTDLSAAAILGFEDMMQLLCV